ncbi:hypothetical protein JHW43_008871 [Diplocarpon mali]|nr:hypothetical protein JHW43_008871 [Diplocarpon mali]
MVITDHDYDDAARPKSATRGHRLFWWANQSLGGRAHIGSHSGPAPRPVAQKHDVVIVFTARQPQNKLEHPQAVKTAETNDKPASTTRSSNRPPVSALLQLGHVRSKPDSFLSIRYILEMAGGGIRGIAGSLSLILIGGALVLMFFVVLSGVKDTTPLNKSYFLRADTSSFPGSGRAESYWTFWKMCASPGGSCGATVPAMPLGYAWVGGSDGVPSVLTGGKGKNTTSDYYYYLWRFGWVFYLMSIALTGFTFLLSLLAPCSRLASGISGTFLAFSLFWFSLAASLMTAVFVKARNEFRSAGIDSQIGKYAFGFTWGAWAAMFLATIFLFLGCGASSRQKRSEDNARVARSGSRSGAGGLGNLMFFKRQRSRRSTRGSFIETESQRRVKEEY